MSENKLLAIARKNSIGLKLGEITPEHIELVVAFLRDEVTVRGVAMAMNLASPGQVTHRIPHILRVGLQNGWIKIEFKH